MAEGLLNNITGSKSPERLGHEYFEKLLSLSFFQHSLNDESLFVMHDLMNNLATFVAGDFFIRSDNEMEMDKDVVAKCRHMSFIREEFVGYQKFEPLTRAKSLRTFLAVSAVGVKESWEHLYLSNKILVSILPELPLLRVLNLSGFEIGKVPEFIEGLKHLRYLNLSETKINELPENVGNLYNLQTLILFGCPRLSKLPNSFVKLKKLRHFDIRETPLLKQMPLGIGELKSLETLTKVIIGGDDGFAINELKELQNLQGKISMKGLDKVQNAMHAWEANLSAKRIYELELEWGDVFDGCRNETLEKEVLNVLKPQDDKLKKLGIVWYGGIEFPNWVGNPSFLGLVHVSIRGCRKCVYLPPLGQLPSLKELYIEGMDEVKVIGSELLGTNGVSFPSLEILSFTKMAGWKEWSANRVEGVFPVLRELTISACMNLVEISLEALPSLRVLKVAVCYARVLRYLVRVASSVTLLEIGYIFFLTDEEWRGVIEYLKAVEEVTMIGCDEISYLREPDVVNSGNLVSLGENENDDASCGRNLLTSLRILNIFDCTSLKCCDCPSSIEKLRILCCKSITSVSFPTSTGERKKLRSLNIDGCEELMDKELRGENMLEYAYISRWTNLKSIVELQNFIHLTHLSIRDCPSIESFPDLQLPNLSSLKDLAIKNCPSMDASFSCGLWPPRLVALDIGGLKNPISKWGAQKFPTSLVHLQYFGEDVTNFTQLSHLLPSSLNYIRIYKFENLESLSVGLQHLTSLRHLSIDECPKMKYLPEMLLPSLLSLKTDGCTNLRERISGRGSYYWPLISHIPCLKIDRELQS